MDVMPLCVPCDRYFTTERALTQHLQSPKHRCNECERFFKSPRSKKQHLETSRSHRVRSRHEPVGNLRSSSCETASTLHDIPALTNGVAIPTPVTPYIGVPREEVVPVFKKACYLRFKKPDVDMLLQHVNTRLDRAIVSALIEAALRLLPPAHTLEGKIEAAKIMQKKAQEAQIAEASFVDRVRRSGRQFLTENEQKALKLSPTPDIRFSEPVLIDGRLCYWLEYKNFFGFRSNPFINSKTKKQLKKYASCLGPGAVVYKLGFEIDHIVEAGIHLFREAEALCFFEQSPIDSTLRSGLL